MTRLLVADSLNDSIRKDNLVAAEFMAKRIRSQWKVLKQSEKATVRSLLRFAVDSPLRARHVWADLHEHVVARTPEDVLAVE